MGTNVSLFGCTHQRARILTIFLVFFCARRRLHREWIVFARFPFFNIFLLRCWVMCSVSSFIFCVCVMRDHLVSFQQLWARARARVWVQLYKV